METCTLALNRPKRVKSPGLAKHSGHTTGRWWMPCVANRQNQSHTAHVSFIWFGPVWSHVSVLKPNGHAAIIYSIQTLSLLFRKPHSYKIFSTSLKCRFPSNMCSIPFKRMQSMKSEAFLRRAASLFVQDKVCIRAVHCTRAAKEDTLTGSAAWNMISQDQV